MLLMDALAIVEDRKMSLEGNFEAAFLCKSSIAEQPRSSSLNDNFYDIIN